MRLVISLLSLLSAMGIMAQQYRTLGDFVSDKKGNSIKAWMELSLTKDQYDYNILSLKILPDRDDYHAPIDTFWQAEAPYDTAPPVKTETYEDRDIMFLYTFNTSDILTTYYVFSSYVDTSKDGLTQIVIRKYTAGGRRIWCLTANATDAQTKEFIKVLKNARKKLRFDRTKLTKGYHRRSYGNYLFHGW